MIKRWIYVAERFYHYGECIPIIIRYGIICFSPYSVDRYHSTWEELDVDKSDADNDTDNDGKLEKNTCIDSVQKRKKPKRFWKSQPFLLWNWWCKVKGRRKLSIKF